VNIEHTLLSSKHAVLNLTISQGGAERYSQLQKDFKDLQAKFKAKEEECMVFEQQCNFLSEAFQSGAKHGAPASSSNERYCSGICSSGRLFRPSRGMGLLL
jgi:hypothetical protein